LSQIKIASLQYKRPDAPEGFDYKDLGSVHWDFEKEKAWVHLYGWRQGLVWGNCYKEKNGEKIIPPYIQGDLVRQVDQYKEKVVEQWVGFITTTDGEEEDSATTYSAILEIMPINDTWNKGVWIPVRLT